MYSDACASLTEAYAKMSRGDARRKETRVERVVMK
jgi:hypothetical protein